MRVRIIPSALFLLSSTAFGQPVNAPAFAVVVAPGWADQNEYDLEAKADGPAGKEQLQLMLRALLLGRFKLAAHEEEQERRVYELTTGKDGSKSARSCQFPRRGPACASKETRGRSRISSRSS